MLVFDSETETVDIGSSAVVGFVTGQQIFATDPNLGLAFRYDVVAACTKTIDKVNGPGIGVPSDTTLDKRFDLPTGPRQELQFDAGHKTNRLNIVELEAE